MSNKKIRIFLLITLCFIFVLGIIIIPSLRKNYTSVKSNKYSTPQIAGFEKSLFGSTGWAAIDLPLKETANGSSNTVTTVSEGQPFIILGESGNYWEIKYGSYHGYVEHNYCMINLPDVVPSIKYNITNANESIYTTANYDVNGVTHNDIDGITGTTLYGNCSNNTCQKVGTNGKVMNNKIGRNEFIVPSLYSTAKKIAAAQILAVQNNRSLMIYDSYRPFSVSQKVSNAFSDLLNSNSEVLAGLGGWDKSWFLASNMSSHNVGVAIDVSLWDNQNNQEVADMPTVIHNLSAAATRCSSATNDASGCTLSSSMQNSTSAMLLSNIMSNQSVGMTPLASEWWHFQDNVGLERMKTATNTTGRNFQVTNIVSTFGYTGDLTTVGDVNGDGNIDLDDAELIYDLYMFLQDNTCDTCSGLVSYSDVNNNGQLDLGDVYSILNSSNDLITSSIYSITDDYINVGYYETFNSDNVILKSISNVSREVSNNKYLIKFHNTTIKSLDIVIYSYTGHDLSKQYIYVDGMLGLETDVLSDNFVCVNCVISVDSNNNKVYIKKNSNDQQYLAEYDLVYFTSSYLNDTGIINSPVITAEELLNNISCYNCEASVYHNHEIITTGTIPVDSSLDINETITNSNSRVARIPINFAVTDVLFDDDYTLKLHLDEPDPTRAGATVFPSYATNKNVTWESSDTSVVTVDDEGCVTPVGVGSATITVTTEDGGYTDTRNVVVDEYATYRVSYRIGSELLLANHRYGDKINVYFDELEREGYRFVGWLYDGNVYSLNDTLSMPRYNVELVAQWETITVDIQNYTVEGSGNDKYIKGISLKTDVSDLDLGVSSSYTVNVYESNGTTLKSSGNVGTGNVIKIYNGNEFVDSYTVSIKGDVNGDGDFKVGDIVRLYNYLFDGFPAECYEDAADYNNDGQNMVGDIVTMYNSLFDSN